MAGPEATAQPGGLGMQTPRGWLGHGKHVGLLPCFFFHLSFRHPILYQEAMTPVKPREKQGNDLSQRTTCQGCRSPSPPPAQLPPQAQSEKGQWTPTKGPACPQNRALAPPVSFAKMLVSRHPRARC